VDGAGGVLDEEQDLDPREQDGVDVEQGARKDPLGLKRAGTHATTARYGVVP